MASLTPSAVLGAVLLGTLSLTPAAAADHPGDTDPTAPEQRPVAALTLTTTDGEPVDLPGESAAAPLAGVRTFGDAVRGDATAPALLTEPVETEEFYVAALTWDGDLAPGTELYLRARSDEQWAEWSELEPDGGAPEQGEEAVAGSEPYIAAGATAVQVRVTGEDAPGGLELHLIPANPGDEELASEAPATAATTLAASAPRTAVATMSAGSAGDATGDTVTRPGIVSRAGWGADESLMRWTPENHTLRAAVVHHTAGHNNYSPADSPSIVRGIYHYHAVTRDWGDIGYNFVVDKYGQMFEGRSGSLAAPPGQMPEGAHARGFNHGTLGISVLGNYTSVRAPQLVLETMADVIAWQFDEAGLDVADQSGFTSPGTPARPAGQQLPRIFAHRDVGATTCPGDNIYARIPALISDVAQRTDTDDVVEYHLRNSLAGGPADLMVRLGMPDDDVLVGDWDGDGLDTLALRRGNEYHVYNTFRGGTADRVVHYGRDDDVVLVGDWDGDGRDTFTVRRGNQYHVKNSLTPGDADQAIRYGRSGDAVLVGDWDGNGTDTFAVRRAHEYHVKNTIGGGDADTVLRYGRGDDVVLVGDWDGDGRDTFTVRRGKEYHVRNMMAGGDADVVFTYGRAEDTVLVGDWDADGVDTLGVRRD